MNTIQLMNVRHHRCSSIYSKVSLIVLAFGLFAGQSLFGAEDKTMSEKAQSLTKEAEVKLSDAGTAVSDTASDLWRKFDSARLKNRTRDEIVAWVIMGVLVGAVAGMFTSLKTTGMGKAGRLLLGLAGAVIGGVVVRMRDFDFGWGPVLIRYEELFFSFVGAVVLIVLGKFLSSKSKKEQK